MEYKEFSFLGKKIRGFFYPSYGNDLVLVLHGFTGNKADHHFMLKQFAECIHACGYSCYRFDFLGAGDSDGLFHEEASIASQIEQVKVLVNEFQKEGYRVHLFAFSLGGVIASHIAKQENIASLFLLSPAGNFNEVLKKMLQQAQPIEDGYDYSGFIIQTAFIQEANEFPHFDNIASYQGFVKLVQGDNDQFVSKESMENYRRSYKNIETVVIKNADHCFSSLQATNCVRKEIMNFYGKIKILET